MNKKGGMLLEVILFVAVALIVLKIYFGIDVIYWLISRFVK